MHPLQGLRQRTSDGISLTAPLAIVSCHRGSLSCHLACYLSALVSCCLIPRSCFTSRQAKGMMKENDTSQMSGDLRETLISKIDSLLAQVLEDSVALAGGHVQIEACIFHNQADAGTNSSPRRIVLKTFEVDDCRRQLALPSNEKVQEPALSQSDIRTQTRSNSAYDNPRLEFDSTSAAETHRDDNTTTKPRHRSALRRKEVGGLRLGQSKSNSAVDSSLGQTCDNSSRGVETQLSRIQTRCHCTNVSANDGRNTDCAIHTPPRTPPVPTTRQLETDERQFPKRRKLDRDGPAKLEQSTVDKLIEGIWEQIHRPGSLVLGRELDEMFTTVKKRLTDGIAGNLKRIDFEDASRCCQQLTCGSRTSRALEVIVQAHWVDCYDTRIATLREDRPDLRTGEVKKTVLTEACKLFQWSEKELRNRMAIWKGYKEIKDAAGWAALVFAGPGIYRFCKYRMGFDQDAIVKLQSIQSRIEVAADTLEPKWRELLSLVGAPTQLHWRGHPHDWVVSKRKDPVPLSFTYRHLDPVFHFKHIEDSIVDQEKWKESDPRRLCAGPTFICKICSGHQSTLAEQNECECFPNLFGPIPRTPPPVQVFRTESGKMNGVITCCTFERGHAIGEFVGLITNGVNGVDVMQGQAGQNEPYQIWQGQCGNFTRFINHSCQPNCQFQTFSWLGIQRILVVAKGVPAGKEVTVDYSGRYWRGLDKECLCGEARCRYKSRIH